MWYIWNNNKYKIIPHKKIIINALIQLQNRGYDSSGICTLSNNNTFEIHKYASTNELSSIDKLLSLNLEEDDSSLGLGIIVGQHTVEKLILMHTLIFQMIKNLY